MTRYTVTAVLAALALCAPVAAGAQTMAVYPPPVITPINANVGTVLENSPKVGEPTPDADEYAYVPPVALVPVAPGSVWVQGHYNWDPTLQNYIWIAGEYAQPPHSNAGWIPGHWRQTPTAWIWVDGSWN